MVPIVFGRQHVRVPLLRLSIVIEGMPALLRWVLGVRSDTAEVRVGNGVLDVWFGLWRLCTPLSNLAGIEQLPVTGSTIGIGLAPLDHGVVLGSVCETGRGSAQDIALNTAQKPSGVSVRLWFRRPVAAAGPPGALVHHPWIAFTTTAPWDLVAALVDTGTEDDADATASAPSGPAAPTG